DVAKVGNGTPIAFRREVQDPGRRWASVQIWHAEMYFVALAATAVVCVHVREAALKVERDPLAHDAYRVDGVCQSLGVRIENIAHLGGHRHRALTYGRKAADKSRWAIHQPRLLPS